MQEDSDGDGIGDLCYSDQDSDGLNDRFEQEVSLTDFLNPDTDGDGLSDGQEDMDADGFSNVLEQLAGTDPKDPISIPQNVTVTIHLKPGFNSISLPLAYSSLSVLTPAFLWIGWQDVVDRVLEFDLDSGQFLYAYYDSAGQPAGDRLMLSPDLGLIVYARNLKTLTYSVLLSCPSYDLIPGLNHVGFPCVSSGMSAFQLLQRIGDESVVSSIQRFNHDTSLFETAVYNNGQLIGTDFPVIAGEGYFVLMKSERLGFRL